MTPVGWHHLEWFGWKVRKNGCRFRILWKLKSFKAASPWIAPTPFLWPDFSLPEHWHPWTLTEFYLASPLRFSWQLHYDPMTDGRWWGILAQSAWCQGSLAPHQGQWQDVVPQSSGRWKPNVDNNLVWSIRVAKNYECTAGCHPPRGSMDECASIVLRTMLEELLMNDKIIMAL